MLSKAGFTGNTYGVMLLRLLLVLILLFLSRILIYFFNVPLFSEIGAGDLIYIFIAGLRFDLFTLVSVNLPFILLNSIPLKFKYKRTYQRFLDIVFYVMNSLALMLNFVDVIYFRFTGKRMTVDVYQYIGDNKTEIISLIPDFVIDFWPVFVLFLIFVFFLVYVGRRIRVNYSIVNRYNRRSYIIDALMFVLFMGVFLVMGRGGLQLKPIDLVNAGEHTNPEYFPLLLNTPFTVIKTNDRSAIERKDYFSGTEDLNAIFNPVHKPRVDAGPFQKTNVVIIVLESFTAEHSAFLNPGFEGGDYEGYTPFLDSLMRQSLVFRGFANGEKSIDGIPAILSSIPSLMNSPYLNSPYVSNKINSIGGLLREKGYETGFFHGGTNGTMSFESYTKIAGFERYYGRIEFDNDNFFDGNWGIFDEPFLLYTAQILNDSKKPFFSTVFTLSSHHPYTIPEELKGKFKKGPLDVHESIGYSDYALSRFFNTIKDMDWFENTLFVITADHTYSGYYPFYKTSVGRYSIPVIFYKKNSDWAEMSDKIAQQCDIMPSVLDFLNYPEPYVAFGQSVFDSVSERFAISYLTGIYQLIQGDFVYKFDGEKDVSLYNISVDSLMRKNVIDQSKEVTHHLSRLTKAIVQQYNNRMLDNQLIVGEEKN
ncbi:MAG: sulfatase-like hydrolase/transferase [Bacteroidales bacterium]